MTITFTGGIVATGEIIANPNIPPPPAEIAVNAVNFDGTDYLKRNGGLTGASDSKLGIFSVWLKRSTINTGTLYIMTGLQGGGGGSNGGTNLRFTTDKVTTSFNNFASNVILHSPSTKTLQADGWVHVLISWDVGNSLFDMFLNDVDSGGVPTFVNDFPIDNTGTDFFIGSSASAPGAFEYEGDMAEFYLQPGEYLDFTVEDNRRKFISAGGKPVDLETNGSGPTGTQPLIYLTNPTATWQNNKGSGGGFNEIGTLTTASTSPSD